MIGHLNIISLSSFVSFFISVSYGVFTHKDGKESKWENSLEHQVTRCFRVENVKALCDSYKIPDSKGKVSAELEISATDVNGKNFVYGYGKSIEGNLCRTHLTKIQNLLKKQDQVCITGDGENVLDSGETYSRWRDLETRLGKVTW